MKNWVRGMFGRKTATIVTRRPRARLGLEGLDDRLAPAVLTVNSILDTANPAEGYLTLRQAIGIVNSPTLPGGLSEEIQDQISGTLHGGGVDTIVFDPSLVTAPIVLTGGALELTVDSDVSRVTVDGGDGVTVDANLASRVFIIEIGSWASFTNLTIANGNFEAPALSPGGGGILNAGTLTITDSTFSGNITSAFDGGGGGAIANTESGVLTIIDSTFTGNIADDSSDGGSGLYNLGTATVVGSTFVENGGPNAVNGGAIAVIGGHVGVLNSTFSGNQASYGSAIFVRYATATIISSTFANNDDTGFGANAVIYIQGATTVLNSVFSANTAGGAPGAAIFDATSGSLATTAGNIESVTAVLAPLANNGGPTQTHAPLGGSPAIAAGVAPTTVAGLTDMLTPIIAVADATRLVLIPNVSVILIDGEQMLVTAVNGNMLTVTRGFNGTLRAPHTLTAGVYPAFDQRGMPRLINGAIDAGATQMRPLTVTGPVTPQTVNASAVTVAGTVPAADSLVQVYKDVNNNGVIDVGDDLVASQQLTGGATTYSVAVPLDRNAVNNFLVTATPPLGSESAPADVPTVIEDSAPPNTPVVSGPATPVEVNAAAYTITGTAEADSLVTVYVDADNSGTLTAGDTIAGTQQLTGGATAYSITVPLAQDAVNLFVVTSTDAAENASEAAAAPVITEDSTLPNAPAVSGPATPVVVNAAAYTITGTAEADSLVTVYVDADNSGTLTAGDTIAGTQQLTGGATAYSITVPLAQDAVNLFVVTSTDAAENASLAVTVPLVTEDSTPPDAPQVEYPLAPVTINAPNFTLVGVAEAGSFVTIYVDVDNSGDYTPGDTIAGTQQMDPGVTSFAITVPLTQDAVNRFLFTSSDAVGNESAAVAVPFITEDSAPPTAPVVSGPATPAQVNAATYTITGTAEADSLVTVYVDADGSGTYTPGDTIAGTQQLAGGATAYSIEVTLAQDTMNRFVVTSTDAATNASAATAAPVITEDSAPPTAPVVTGPATPVVVNAPTVTIAGTAEADSLVTVYVDADGSGTYTPGDTVAGTQQLTGGATTFSITVPLTQDVASLFVVTSTDAAENESLSVMVPLVTEDSTPPVAPAVLMPTAAATVNAPTVDIMGMSEPGSLVRVYIDADNSGTLTAGDTVVGTQQLAGGSIPYSITVPLTQDGVNRFLVTGTDAAGNESVAAVVPVITEDSTPPAAPVVTGPTTPVVVNAPTVTIAGTAEADSLVTVYVDADGSGTYTPGDTIADTQQLTGGATAYSITVPLAQDAVNLFVVTSTDAAENESVATTIPAITEDSTAPAAPAVTGPTAVATVNAATVTVMGTAEADSLVTVYVDADGSGTLTDGDTVVGTQQLTGGATVYSITVPLTPDAVNRLIVTSTDATENASEAASVPAVVEDSTAPAAPVVQTPAGAITVMAATAAIVGTAETNSLVTVYADVNGNGVVDAGDTVVIAVQLDGDASGYSITVPLARNAVNRFLVTSTDTAGNESAAAVVPMITELSTPPAAPIVISPAARVATVAGTVVLTGTAPAGSLVTAYRDVNGNGVVDAGDAVVGTQQLDGGAAAYAITVDLVPNAVNQFLVTATDAVGQVSPAAVVPNVVQGEPNPGVPLAFSAGADVGGGVAQLFNPDGTVRLTVEPFPGTPGGVRVATADLTGDGVPDLVAGTGPGTTTRVKVYDGATGAVLLELTPFEAGFTGGVYVEATDLDSDGRAELIVTPDQGGGPRVQIFDGATGVVRQNFFGIDDPGFRGGARASTADVNGDGVADLIVAAGFGGGPRVSVFDGAALRDGMVRQIANFFVFEDTLRNGVYITAGDVDGDGFADVIAGGGPGGGPRVYAISGKALLETGAQVPVADFFAGDTASRAGIRVATADLDLDGRADLIVGSGQGDGSQVTVYLSKDVQPTGTPPATTDFDAFTNLNASNLFAGGVFVG